MAVHRSHRAPSAALATAAVLRREILDRNEVEWFLGTEEELLARLRVSRPTLRQAARILEQEQLLTVRRGVNGGLFGRIPTSRAVAQVSSVYLESQRTSLHQLGQANAVISPAVARLAAANPAEEARRQLREWVADYQSLPAPRPRHEMFDLALEFGRRVAALSGNPPLALFEEVLFELSLWSDEMAVMDPAPRVEVIRRHHLELATAIAEGDGDAAFDASHRFTQEVLGWVAEADAGRRPKR